MNVEPAERVADAPEPSSHDNEDEWCKTAGLSDREKAVAKLTIFAPFERRMTLKQVSEALELSYEVARLSRTKAAKKLGLDVRKFHMPRGVKPTDPTKLSEIEQAMADRTVFPAAEERMSIADAARDVGVDFQSAYNARARALDKLGINPHDCITPRSKRQQRKLFTWENDLFALIAHVDPTFARSPAVVRCQIAVLRGFDIPEHLRRGLVQFRRKTDALQSNVVLRAQATVEAWRKRYQKGHECTLCADLASRRPCPGLCPVCRRPGERELLERPETLRSSAGLIEGEE